MSKNDVVSWKGIPSDPEQLKAIKDAVSCTFECYDKIERAKEELKDIFDAIHETTGIPKRTFNFLARSNYKGNGYETVAKNSELADALDAMETVK